MPVTELKGVKIGDVFKTGSNRKAKVVDFYAVVSVTTKKVVNHMCIAQDTAGLSTNLFDVPFSTVVRNKVVSEETKTKKVNVPSKIDAFYDEEKLYKYFNASNVDTITSIRHKSTGKTVTAVDGQKYHVAYVFKPTPASQREYYTFTKTNF